MLLMKKKASMIGNRSKMVTTKSKDRYRSYYCLLKKIQNRCCNKIVMPLTIKTINEHLNDLKLKEIEKFMRCPNKQRELYKNDLEIIIKNRIKRDIEANYPDDYIKGYYPLLEQNEFTIFDTQVSATAKFKTMVGVGNSLYYGQNYQYLGKVKKVISNNILNVADLTLESKVHNYKLYIKIDDYIIPIR